MPVYDYACECGNKRTQTVSIEVKDFKAICDCGKEMKRVYAAPNIKFNGSGFYTTDKGNK
jgi:putative FmdB family regulatory protein